jgi:SAM-dependent methyltransferase
MTNQHGSNSANAFSDESFVERFIAHRLAHGPLFNESEHDAMMALLNSCRLGPLLELGCGAGGQVHDFVARGFSPIVAVDRSAPLIEYARKAAFDVPVDFLVADVKHLNFPPRAFSVVVSSLMVHFVEEIDALFERVSNWLQPEGMFMFSVRHPIRTSNPVGEVDMSNESWRVDRYLTLGARQWIWLDSPLQIFHRTIEAYFDAIVRAGLRVTEVREVGTLLENSSSISGSPAFLLFSASKV